MSDSPQKTLQEASGCLLGVVHQQQILVLQARTCTCTTSLETEDILFASNYESNCTAGHGKLVQKELPLASSKPDPPPSGSYR